MEILIAFDSFKGCLSSQAAGEAFARGVRGERLSLVAEASTPGGEEYNVRLSERRLRRVVEILVSEGLSAGDLRPATAIGARNGKDSSEGRRVTITVVKE